MANPNVAFVRPEVVKLNKLYSLIRDAVNGEVSVKAAGDLYLPRPNAADKSNENRTRYDAYLLRAVYYNATRRTLNGLLGQVFAIDPVVEVPEVLQHVVTNASGTGIGLVQLAKDSESEVIAYSRSGLFVDYPETGGGATKAQIASGEIRATISTFSPWQIINWRTKQIGAEEKLSLVVLYESYESSDDGFEVSISPQFRVLKLNDAGNYVQQIWKEEIPTKFKEFKFPISTNFAPGEEMQMLGADGFPMTEIPFRFIGSLNNEAEPDEPNFYDLASLNMAHYRNSADYEEMCYMVGQATPVVTGIDEDWFNKVMKGVIAFGSRGGIPLPSGATVELLQVQSDGMTKEALDIKERQMVALGAKLVEQKTVQRTATEASMENASETSTLTSITRNVSAAYLWALKLCARLVGESDASIKFELNTDFDVAHMSPEEQNAAIDQWQKGAITFTEMRAVLRKAGIATEDDEQAKEGIAKDSAEAMAAAMAIENTPSGNGGKDE